MSAYAPRLTELAQVTKFTDTRWPEVPIPGYNPCTMSNSRSGLLFLAIVILMALGPARDCKTNLGTGPGTGGNQGTMGGSAGGAGGAQDAGGTGDSSGPTAGDTSRCDASAIVGRWYRALDGLIMVLNADGCSISGTSDNIAFSHTIAGTYDEVARTMVGTINRKTISSGCTTLMNATWVITDPTHFTFAITSTDGHCDLRTTYNEVSTFVRQ